MLFIFRPSLISSTVVNDKLVLLHRVENIQSFVHPYIFSTYSHKNKYSHLLTNLKIEPKNKKFYFIKKTAFNESNSPVERSLKDNELFL